jgi:hypothetical protein
MGAAPALDEALLASLMYGLMPLWAAAGVGDWLCHRWQRMERTAGLGESALHLLMLLILAPATLAALFLQINAHLLAWLVAACVAHELVFWWDLAYASRRRTIPPVEQWVHGIQFATPWVGLAGLALLHRDQAVALIGLAGAPLADWTLRIKDDPLPADYVAVVLVAGALLVCLPFLEEFWRCLRVRRAGGGQASGRLRDHQVEDHDERQEGRYAKQHPVPEELPVARR